jgi:hypothetical protein
MKNTIFHDVTPCGAYKNRRFGGVLLMEKIGSSEMQFLIRATGRNIPEDGALH